MKKLFLIAALFTTLVFSSTDVERTFGLFGGLSIANISYASGTESTRKGMNLGLDFEFPITKHIFLVPNVYVVEKGEVNSASTIRLNYLEVSFAPKYKSSPDATGIYFLLGPYVASILASSATSNAGVETDLDETFVRNTEGGILAGIGFETLISHHWTAYLEAKYAMGLTRSLESLDGKNRAIYVNLGFHYLDREDLETNIDRAEEFVKRKSDPSNLSAGEQSIRLGSQEPFDSKDANKNALTIGKEEVPPGKEKLIGFYAGLSSSSTSFEDTNGSDGITSKNSAHLGVNFDYPLDSGLVIEPGLSFANKGVSGNESTVNLYYLDFSFFAKLRTSGTSTGLYFLAGPSLGILISGSIDSKLGRSSTFNSSDYQTIEYGIVGGLGYEFSITPNWNLFLEGKYDYGLSNVSSNSAATVSNRAFYIDLGLHYLMINNKEDD